MIWTVGKDHRHRASVGEYEAEISLCTGRTRWKVVIFKVGVGRLAIYQPFATMRNARKRGETELRRLNAKEEEVSNTTES